MSGRMAGLTGVLPRYFMRRYAATFLRVLVSVSALILLIDTIELSRRAAGIDGFTLPTIIGVSLLRVPNALLDYVQFIVLIAAMMTLLALNAKQELVIARASGVSVWQFLAPLCVASLMIGAATVAIVNPLAANAMARAESLSAERGLRESGAGTVLPWFRQTTEDGVVVIGAQQAADRGTRLAAAQFVFIGADGGVKRRIDARQALLQGDEWVLTDAVSYRDGQPGETLAEARVASTIDREFLNQALTSPGTVPFFALPASIAAANAFGLPSNPYAMEWHSTLALPAFLVAMTLIAATVSLRFARFGQSSAAILGGIVAGFLLYVVGEIAKSFGASDVIAPVVAAWLPVTAAALFGVTFLLHREDG